MIKHIFYNLFYSIYLWVLLYNYINSTWVECNTYIKLSNNNILLYFKFFLGIRAGWSYTALNISFCFFDGQFYAINPIILKHFIFKLFIIYQIFNLLFLFNDKSTHDKEKLFQDHVDDQITTKELKKNGGTTKSIKRIEILHQQKDMQKKKRKQKRDLVQADMFLHNYKRDHL